MCQCIPKKSQPGKWRLIVDLSAPDGASVNDGIVPSLCSLLNTSVDDATAEVLQLGKGALLAKLDIQHAYRIVPVHPDDRHLLGMSWKGEIYVDTTLPFGLRSAPKIFTDLADAIEWVFKERGVPNTLHYLDDFLFIGHSTSDECASALELACQICKELGVSISPNKVEGPATYLVFLGIEFDTEQLLLRLPLAKLSHLRADISSWQSKKCATKRELLSLIGILQHAAKVVKPGRTFLRRLIDPSSQAKELHHHVLLNLETRSDLQ